MTGYLEVLLVMPDKHSALGKRMVQKQVRRIESRYLKTFISGALRYLLALPSSALH